MFKIYLIAIFVTMVSCSTFNHRDQRSSHANLVGRAPAASIQTCWKALMAIVHKKRNVEKKTFSYQLLKKLEEDHLEFDTEYPLPKDLNSLLKKAKVKVGESYETKFFLVTRISKRGDHQYNFIFKKQSQIKGGDGINKSYIKDSEIWLSDDKFYVGDKDQFVTFSTDSELPLEDAYRGVNLETSTAIRMDKLLERFKLTKKEASKKLGISEKQVDAFGLRKDVSKDKEFYIPSDFAPGYFQKLMVGREKFLSQNFTSDVASNLQKQGLPINAHIDLDYIELTHHSWEEIPSKFKELMNSLHTIFKHPMSHLHLGIPVDHVNRENVIRIAQVLEANIVLLRAMNFGKNVEPLKYYDSNFTERGVGNRGMLKLGLSEWKKPFRSHNLEIRQYPNISYGLRLLELGALLVKDVDKLNYPDKFKAHKIKDFRTQSLNQSLRLMGYILKSHSSYSDIGDKMIQFSDRIQEQGQISDDMREDVQTFLKSEKVERILKDTSIYFKN